MRILVVGGNGMLGHKLVELYSEQYTLAATFRQNKHFYQNSTISSNKSRHYYGVDVCKDNALFPVFQDFKPNVVINCVGYIDRHGDMDPEKNIAINALLPHRLSQLCREFSARLIQISTDCVFSGKKGLYKETDPSDTEKFYGKAKFLGEVASPVGITLRTSIIGLELEHRAHLVEWFLSQKGKVSGYTKAIYSGVTTTELARVIEHILIHCPNMSGIWHVASKPISKYSILSVLKNKLDMHWVDIEPDDSFVCDRSLVADQFAAHSGYQIHDWEFMLNELVQEIKIREHYLEDIRK